MGAANQSVNASELTADDGWAADLNIRGKRILGIYDPDTSNTSEDEGLFGISAQNHGSWVWRSLTSETSKNLAGGTYGFPWAAGSGYDTSDGPTGLPRQAMLFDLPRADSVTAQSQLLSLGQLQHFAATGYTADDVYTGDTVSDRSESVFSYTPSLTIGNSYASPFVSRDEFAETVNGTQFADWSYVLNDVLFDSYFFSGDNGNPASTPDTFLNGRLLPFDSSQTTSGSTTDYTATAEQFLSKAASM